METLRIRKLAILSVCDFYEARLMELLHSDVKGVN
jgi:hypothetical protein